MSEREHFNRRSFLLTTTLAGAGLAFGMKSALAAESALTIGSANFAESQLIATIYSEALKNAGVAVTEKFNIGSREVYMQALEDHSIDLVPEYDGTLLSYFDPSNTETDKTAILKKLQTILSPKGLEALTASSAQDVDELAVKKEFADKHGLKNISDLTPVAKDMILAGPPEWKTRFMGVPGLEKVYGLHFKRFLALDAGGPLTLNALKNGMAQVGDMFSSDPAVEENGLVPLVDDKHLFGSAAILPIIRKDRADAKITSVLDGVSKALDQKDLIEMNKRINAGDSLRGIAVDWLKAHPAH